MARGEVEVSGAPGPDQGALAKETERRKWEPPSVGPVGEADHPLTIEQLLVLDDVITHAERATGLRFSAYLGDLGGDTRGRAESLLGDLGEDAPMAVLLAVSPGQRVVEVVTGSEAARRVSDRAARLAVLAVVSSCADGDVFGALSTGLRILADQAGTLPERSSW
ncbi:DUF5130 family protein [Nakamurella flavida]|uniref:DUF5130 family protein n=1 Tax=Nakamurella flavida TaxID=363630 RepID=A0A938YM56_9ACTN|nr:DUF5130 family protein [Nakamurella flavida]MBM9477243.1 DUF5130 family protein [Nakamurella flavida]MDP9776386.1 hypothetical protein [Nakamurella flavida]